MKKLWAQNDDFEFRRGSYEFQRGQRICSSDFYDPTVYVYNRTIALHLKLSFYETFLYGHKETSADLVDFLFSMRQC
jgi:2-iminoacetate synthase ThiH